jgi:hypothetical protein
VFQPLENEQGGIGGFAVIKTASMRLFKNRCVKWAIIGLLVTETCLVLATYVIELARLKSLENEVTYRKGTGPYLWRFEKEGILRPTTRSVQTAGLADDEAVVGVVVDGKARAYWVKALSYPPQHLINDLIEGSPVSIVHCDLSNCTRVYTKTGRSAPLQLASVGLLDSEMVVKVGGVQYFHQSGQAVKDLPGSPPFPYEPVPWTRTTWKAWRTQNPSTDVYVGEHDAPRMTPGP